MSDTLSKKCGKIHLPHATFSHVQSLHRSHSTDDMCAWLKGLDKVMSELCAKNLHSSTRHVQSCASQYIEHQHKFSLTYISCVTFVYLSSSRPVVHASIHCKDPWQDGSSTEYQLLTGYEPKRIELNRTLFNLSNQDIDDQDDIEEIGVKPLSYSQSLIHSAYDSAESIATPPDSDLEDEQLRKMLASPLYTEVSGKLDEESVHKREGNAERAQAYHPRRERLMSSSS